MFRLNPNPNPVTVSLALVPLALITAEIMETPTNQGRHTYHPRKNCTHVFKYSLLGIRMGSFLALKKHTNRSPLAFCLAWFAQVSQAEIDEGAAPMDAFVNATDPRKGRIGAEAVSATPINCKNTLSLGKWEGGREGFRNTQLGSKRSRRRQPSRIYPEKYT